MLDLLHLLRAEESMLENLRRALFALLVLVVNRDCK